MINEQEPRPDGDELVDGPVNADKQPIDPTLALTSYIPKAPYGKSTGAIHRALEILELFAVEQGPLTVGAVCSKLHYPQSSTSVLLRGLAELGYLEHDRQARTFQPTLRVVFLGMWMHHRILNQGSLLEFMETLANSSGHVACLGTQNGIHAQYVHIVAARSSRVGLKPGLLRPICRSAIGKVLLSAKSNEEVRRVVRHVNAVDNQHPSPIDADVLLAELEECRRTGFAESINGVTPGASTIATRLPVDFGDTPLAVGVSVHTTEIEQMRPFIVDLIRDTVAKYFDSAQNQPSSRRTRVLAPQMGYAVVRELPDEGEPG
jgi:DNA-binding IclR family transcriptional regulator